ncbi:MAG: ABC transporter permease subunit [Cyanobacteriota bacterium]|nr:ABC transporter permease subunit [Cyanobacteriota bacterium]
MTTNPEQKTPLWRDQRFWQATFQIVAILGTLSVLWLLWYNLTVNVRNKGVELGFGFLNSQASFAIQESLIPYDPARDSYARVLLAGLLNSLRVMIVGIVLTTVLGVAAGVASFSENWLLRKGSVLYVEVIRNTPLLLQLYFWYRAVFTRFPSPEDRLEFLNSVYLSNRGVFLPWPAMSWRFGVGLGSLVAAAIAAVVLWQWRTKLMVERGQSGQPQLMALGAVAIAFLLLLVGLGWQVPQESSPGLFEGGLRLSIEFSALVTGLVVYTGAYIAEIVRAGIQSVPLGQWEAAKALGLSATSVMRLVVFPQALRVMIPPLNSQYMNLAKNSSLAIAIGYADIYSVANTTYNQTGRPVEVMFIVMATYLSINLIISIAMNSLNRAVQLKER